MTYQAAAAAGAIGTFAMDALQDVATRATNRNTDRRDEETEAIVGVVRKLAPYVPGDFVQTYPGIAGRAVHYLFGSAFAIAYGALRERVPQVAAGRGLAFGVAVWLLSDRILIPISRRGEERFPAADRAIALLEHLAFGTSIEAVLRLDDSANANAGKNAR